MHKHATASVTVILACLFLAASVPSAHAQGGISLANAAIHAVLHSGSSGHALDFYSSALNRAKMMEIVPEPNSGLIAALGGAIGLVVWRLRRRSTRNSVSN